MEPEISKIRRPLVEVYPRTFQGIGFTLPLTPSLGPPVYPKLQKHVKMHALKLKCAF